jgi:hypothetical protein
LLRLPCRHCYQFQMAHLTTRHIFWANMHAPLCCNHCLFPWVPGVSMQFGLCHWTQVVGRWAHFNAPRQDLTAGLPLLVTSLRPHHLSTCAFGLFVSKSGSIANKQDSGGPAKLSFFHVDIFGRRIKLFLSSFGVCRTSVLVKGNPG